MSSTRQSGTTNKGFLSALALWNALLYKDVGQGRSLLRTTGAWLLLGGCSLAAVSLVRRRLRQQRRQALLQLPLRLASSRFDYVIIGGGSAGCALANRLSEDREVTVLLLEAGPPESHHPAIAVPAAAITLQKTEVDWQFMTTPQKGTNGRVHHWPRGKVLGGCGALNWMLYVRGNAEDYNLWSNYFGCEGWSYDDVLPYFLKSEDLVAPSPTNPTFGEHVPRPEAGFHGSGGPFTISYVQDINPVARAFVEAGEHIEGGGINNDYNGNSQLGFAFAQMNVRNGRRCSPAYCFLDAKVRGRPNLTVCPNAHVTRILFNEQNQATGVEFRAKADDYRTTITVEAAEEVILSAGSVGSPHILMLSGVGPKEHLEEKGVPLVHDLPAVGQHMQDHIFCMLNFECLKPITVKKELLGSFSNVLQYMLFKKGPLASQGLEAMAFLRTPTCDLPYPIPDLQIHCVQAGAKSPDATRLFGLEYDENDEDNNKFMFMLIPTLLHPRSKGSVTLASADPMAAPVIDPCYLNHEQDVQSLLEGMKIARQVVRTPAFKDLAGQELLEKALAQQYPPDSDEYLLEVLRKKVVTVYHPVGTCRMGQEVKDSVVDSRLRVHGLAKLRVVDASIMPEIISGNTHAPAIMIAEKAADMIKEERRMRSAN